jgi:hypothetical protein
MSLEARVREAEARVTEAAFSSLKLTKSLAKQIAKRLDKHWTADVKSLDDIRRVLAAGVLKPMSMRDLIDNQDAVRKWANSLSKDDLKKMVRYIEEAHWKGRSIQYRMSDEKLDKLATAPDKTKAFKILDSLVDDINNKDVKSLNWMAGAFTAELADQLNIQVGEAAKLVKKWMRGKTASVEAATETAKSLARDLLNQTLEHTKLNKVITDGEKAVRGWMSEAKNAGDRKLVDLIKKFGVRKLGEEWEKALASRR